MLTLPRGRKGVFPGVEMGKLKANLCSLFVVSVVLLAHAPASASLLVLTEDDVLSIFFEPYSLSNANDTMRLGFRNGSGMATASLYDGSTFLGTSIARPNSGFIWKSPSSLINDDLFSQGNPLTHYPTIDFSSINDGTIQGRIDFSPGAGDTVVVDTNSQHFFLPNYITLGTGYAFPINPSGSQSLVTLPATIPYVYPIVHPGDAHIAQMSFMTRLA